MEARFFKLIDRHTWIPYWIFWGTVVGAIALVIFGFMELGFHLSASQCHGWGMENNRPVRYVQFNWFDRQCITKVANGQWLPTGQVRGVLGGN